ncbi:MAG TPA: alanine racemase [Nitrospiraceae bacterium]|jgi:alanine racemase|nr:alanine racemase [Nitrospiraceae bacterium]
MHRGATAEIDLNAVSRNLHVVRTAAENRPVIAVVKADAYGHGAIEISRRLVSEGVSVLAVAYSDEAIALRKAAIDSPILVLFDRYSFSDFFEYRLIPVIHDVQTAERLSGEAKARGHSLDVHIKVDTGMGRLGLHSERVVDDLNAIAAMDCLNVTGIMSHFSEADIAERSYANEQLKKFTMVRNAFLWNQKKKILFHIANSAAVLSFKDAHLDAVRPGLMLYGYSPFAAVDSQASAISDQQPSFELRPAMKIKTRILCLRRLRRGTPVSYGRTFITKRESLVAVLPVGYADGYSRVLSNTADVLIRGKRAPVVGRVCMDLTMVDVTEIQDVAEDDEVVLLGTQAAQEITAHEVAQKAGTICYEILTTLGSQSKRVYVQ